MGATFDIGAAIGFFFKRFGEKPAGAIWIAFCQLLVMAAFVGLIWMLYWPALESFMLLAADMETRPMASEDEVALAVLELMGPLIGYGTLMGLAGLVLTVVFQTAWLRFLTKGEIAAVIPFRFGMEEVFVLAINLLYGVVISTIAFAAVFLMILLGGIGFAAFGESGLAAGLLVLVGVFATIAAILFFAVRLAPAAALSVKDRQFRFFEAWGASRDRFWGMLLAYIVLGLLLGFLGAVIGGLIQLAVMGAFWPLIGELSRLENAGGGEDPRLVLETLREGLFNYRTLSTIGIASAFAYLLQIFMEAIWNSVGAYIAVLHRDAGPESGDAVTLDTTHPAGASPAEG